MCTYKERRKTLLLKITTVVVVLLSMLSCNLFFVSAASFEQAYKDYNVYTGVDGTAARIVYADGSIVEADGDWSYNRISGNFPNYMVFSYADTGTAVSAMTYYITFDICETYSPGQYLFEFDLSYRYYYFLGWDAMYVSDAGAPPELTPVANPFLYTLSGDILSASEGEARLISSVKNEFVAGYNHDSFQLSVSFDEATYVRALRIGIPYLFTSAEEMTAGKWETFCSDLSVKTYTDDVAAVEKYDPPDTSGVDEYTQAEGEVSNFVDNSGADEYLDTDNLTEGIGDEALDSTFGISALLQYIHDELPFVKNIVYISVSFGIVMLLFNLVPALARRK